jgi:hypothetical protein
MPLAVFLLEKRDFERFLIGFWLNPHKTGSNLIYPATLLLRAVIKFSAS